MLLTKYGKDASAFTEKSCKVQGCTDLVDSGEQMPHIMVHGRWKTETTPLHYRALSINFRLKVAGNFPLV